MINKELVEYIQKNIGSFSREQIKNYLLSSNYSESDIEEAFRVATTRWKPWKIVLLIIGVIILILLIASAWFIFSPNLISKPIIEKPYLPPINTNTVNQNLSIPDGDVQPTTQIKAEHIIYLLNEIEAYKLHNSISGDIPRINFLIKDMNKEFSFTVTDNKIGEIDLITNLDIRISANQDTVYAVYGAEDTKSIILSSYNSKNIEVDLLADMSTLALKGYNSMASYFGISAFSILNYN